MQLAEGLRAQGSPPAGIALRESNTQRGWTNCHHELSDRVNVCAFARLLREMGTRYHITRGSAVSYTNPNPYTIIPCVGAIVRWVLNPAIVISPYGSLPNTRPSPSEDTSNA